MEKMNYDFLKCTKKMPPLLHSIPEAEEFDMVIKKQYCSTCDWYETFSGICSKGNSEHCADFCDPDDTCDEWYKLVIKPEEM